MGLQAGRILVQGTLAGMQDSGGSCDGMVRGTDGQGSSFTVDVTFAPYDWEVRAQAELACRKDPIARENSLALWPVAPTPTSLLISTIGC